jgi:hypothetical protein
MLLQQITFVSGLPGDILALQRDFGYRMLRRSQARIVILSLSKDDGDSGRYSRQNSTTATPAPRIGTRTVTPKPWGITVRVPTGMGANSQK